MRDDRVRLAGNSDLRNHVVIGVAQQRSPEKEDLLLGANEAQKLKECGNVLAPMASTSAVVGFRFPEINAASYKSGATPK
jgi:hypothetical protein